MPPNRTALEVQGGRFRFLNEERRLADPVDWRLADWPDAPRLWRFHLHYQEFLLDLAAQAVRSGEPKWSDRAWDLVSQWIEANGPDDPGASDDAWHPYCISRRLPAWIVLWHAAAPPEALRGKVLESMFWQADRLDRHLEWDLGGNHLLENLRALVLAGVFLDCSEAERWRRKAERVLRREIAEQVLPHGEHFERSPMYHAAMLEVFLDIRDAAAGDLPALSQVCGETAARMAGFLRAVLHPDGEIPFLGDSCLGEVAATRVLLERAESAERGAGSGEREARSGGRRAEEGRICEHPDPESRTLNTEPWGSRRVGDYWVFRDGGDFLLFDAGPVGPDHLPAHAHADLLTLEASIAGRRLFVDSGVFDYEDGPMRRYCRSTAAHNVLQIDGEDQCDMWSRFRMGYRGWPRGLACGKEQDFSWARAEHNAYRRLRVPRVGRWLACRPRGPWFCVDWADGAGTHDLTAWLHLHPEARAAKVGDREISIDHRGVRLFLRFLAQGDVSVEAGWYCPEFGLRIAAPVVRWTAKASLPAVCGWSLSWGDCGGSARLEGGVGEGVTLVWDEGDRIARLRPIEK